MFRFFLKAFSLSLTAILFTWFFEGAFYTYTYTQAEDISDTARVKQESKLVLSKPTVFLPELRDANFLLLGMAGKPYPAPDLTDTIIVGMVRQDPLRLILVSLPRDLFVRVPGGSQALRINALYSIGKSFSPLEPERFIKEKVEEITGLTMDYYAGIDVKGLEAVVDVLGGVDIEVKKAIIDPSFPGPNYSYEPFYLEEGVRHLNGHDAVRFVRSRYAPRGDFERMERQQEFLSALSRKAKEAGISLEKAKELFGSLEGHFFGNIKAGDIPLAFNTLLQLEAEKIKTFTIDNSAGGLLTSYRSDAGASVLIPKEGFENYSQIQIFFDDISA